MNIYIYLSIYLSIYICVYIHIERERERDRVRVPNVGASRKATTTTYLCPLVCLSLENPRNTAAAVQRDTPGLLEELRVFAQAVAGPTHCGIGALTVA